MSEAREDQDRRDHFPDVEKEKGEKGCGEACSPTDAEVILLCDTLDEEHRHCMVWKDRVTENLDQDPKA